jgi:hypothetical protein
LSLWSESALYRNQFSVGRRLGDHHTAWTAKYMQAGSVAAALHLSNRRFEK